MKFTGAINKFFGKKIGQSMQEFAKEIGSLTPKDKEELRPLLEEQLGEKVEL